MNKLIAVLIIVSSSVLSLGQSVTLGWDKNSEPDVSGYKIYRATGAGSTSYLYENTVPPTANPISVNPISVNNIYSFYVTAINTGGLESDQSNIVRLNTFPLTTPVVSGQIVTSTSATLTWPAVTTHLNGDSATSPGIGPVNYQIKTNGVVFLTTQSLTVTIGNLSGSVTCEVRAYTFSAVLSSPGTKVLNFVRPGAVTGLKILPN